MNVSAQTQALVLTQTALAFQAGVSTAPPPQTFSVLNTGVGLVNWTATPQISDGGKWLTVTPASGTATSGVLPLPVSVSVNPQGLAPGSYRGNVQVATPGSGNLPQNVSVSLTVTSPDPAPPPLTPSGVILIGQPTGSSAAEGVSIFNPWSTPLNYSSTVVTDNRVNWLTQTPVSGTVAAGASATISLQATLKGLTPGLQHGALRVAFTDGTVHTVDVYVIVPMVAATPSLRTSTALSPSAIVLPAATTQACPGSTGIGPSRLSSSRLAR